MPLVLEVVRHRGVAPATPRQARFDPAGGGIGRNEANQFVLDDPSKEISNFHAEVRHADGQYVYEDKSTNGSELGKADGRWIVLHRQSAPLADGDALKIGQYELRVRLEAEPRAEAGEAPALDALFEEAAAPGTDLPPDARAGYDDMAGFWDDEPRLTERRRPSPPPEAPAAAREEQGTLCLPLDDAGQFEARTVVAQPNPGAAAEPAQLRQEPEPPRAPPPEPAKAPPPAQAAPAQGADAMLFRCLMEATGLECPKDMSIEEQAETLRNLGLVFRQMVEGMKNLLHVRAQEKFNHRLLTQVLSRAKNPLKDAATSTEAAMKAMLFHSRYADMGYLEPVAATREGVMDIVTHQVATFKGLQVSLQAALETFDPESFNPPSGGLLQSKEARCWKAYCEAYPRLVEEARDNLLKGAFAEEYERAERYLREAQSDN